MTTNSNFYNNKVVYKPWGYEYVAYNNGNRIGITFLKIKKGHKTSLHCHPKKKTGFIILSGKAQVQIGIYKKNRKSYTALSRLVFRPGLFHSIKALSSNGVCALELETPFKKNDLLRFEDSYGRKGKKYEGKKFTKKIGPNLMIFKKPKLGKENIYKFKNLDILLEVRKNFKSLIKGGEKTTTAILDGKVVDNKGQSVISYGEIVKTSTLSILSKVFKINKPLTILRVSKRKNVGRKI